MDNPWDEIRDAVRKAKEINRACDENVNILIELTLGRLRHARAHNLKRLKRDLQGFNAHTGEWK